MTMLKKYLLLILVILLAGVSPARGQLPSSESGEGSLVGRIAHVEGGLLRYVPEEKDWVATVRDAPFGLNDSLYSDATGKAELIMPNNTWARIGGSTQIQLITLRPDVTEVDIASGMGRFYNRSTNGIIKATSPFGYVVAPAGAVFDLYVGDQSLEVISLRGKVEYVGNGDQARYEVTAGAASLVSDGRRATSGQGNVDADWDDWNGDRDRLWASRTEVRGESVGYLPPALHDNAYALDENGRWERVYYEGAYRNFWRPTGVAPGWAPYTMGRWTVYYGDNCWIPYEPFGYVTHHYGNWVYMDTYNRWYWAPPVMSVGVSIGPFLPIPFGWYPGRVGWIFSGLNVGWIPLAPFEPYYCMRPWGPRALVVNNINVTNININRYQYINRAVVINQRNLYNVNNYRNVMISNVNRNTIIKHYRGAPVIDNKVIPDYSKIQGRYHYTDERVDRKPHDSVMDRISRNELLGKEPRGINANIVQRDLAAIQPGKPLPDTRIQPPRISDKLVGGDQVNRPQADVQFQQRDLKVNARPPSEISGAPGPVVDGKQPPPVQGGQSTLSGQTGSPTENGQRIRPPKPSGAAPQAPRGLSGHPAGDGQKLRPPKPVTDALPPETGQVKPAPGNTPTAIPSAPQQGTRPPAPGTPGQPGNQDRKVKPARPGVERQPGQQDLSQPPADDLRRPPAPGTGRESRPPSRALQQQAPSGGVREFRPPDSRRLNTPVEGPKESLRPQAERPSGRVSPSAAPFQQPSGKVRPPLPQPQPSVEQGRAPVPRPGVSKPQAPPAVNGGGMPRAPQGETGGGKGKQGHIKGSAESQAPQKGND